MFSTRLLLILFVLVLPATSSAAQTNPENQELIWQKIRDYAACIQTASGERAVTSHLVFDQITTDCKSQRKALQEIAPGRRLADRVDDQVRGGLQD